MLRLRIKVLQLKISVFIVEIVRLYREITRMNWNPSNTITETCLAKQQFQNELLSRWQQATEIQRRRLGECAAKAENRLCGIDNAFVGWFRRKVNLQNGVGRRKGIQKDMGRIWCEHTWLHTPRFARFEYARL